MQELKRMTIDFGNGSKTYVLTPEDEYDEQQANESKDHTFEDFKWAMKLVHRSRNTLVPLLDRYRDQLDVENGGCVFYSGKSGKPWKFYPKEFEEFVSNIL